MPSKLRSLCVLAALSTALSMARSSHADVPTEPEAPPPPALRIGAALTGGYASLERSTSDPTNTTGGFTLGGELRVNPWSAHGILLAYTDAEGIFGPSVNIVDAAYSLRLLSSAKLEGVTGAVYLDLGPSVGYVRGASPTPNHAVLGGRASVTCDLQLANVVVGVTMGYRGGVPVGVEGDPWEGALSAVARLGVVFDVGARARAR